MARNVTNWTDAAADAYSHLMERDRGYDKQKMVALVDELVLRGAVTQEDLIQKHGGADFIATTLGHVTTAAHGPGNVLRTNGWYSAAGSPPTYVVHPEFAAAWKVKRRLPRAASGA